MKHSPAVRHLAPEIRSLVHHSVSLLGQVLMRELGDKDFQRIEVLRRKMTTLRGKSPTEAFRTLQKVFHDLQRLPRQKRLDIANAFTLMLELMNTCENAYRTQRLLNSERPTSLSSKKIPESITYVLTAHPTEARSPDNIEVFHEIQHRLIQAIRLLAKNPKAPWPIQLEQDLFHFLEIAWKTSIVRDRAPRVRDEADHIYSTLFRKNIFDRLLDRTEEGLPFFVHTWVGGDKDGHPGVQEKTLLESLSLSRRELLHLVTEQLQELRRPLEWIKSHETQKKLLNIEKQLSDLRALRSGDGRRVRRLREKITLFCQSYAINLGGLHPALAHLKNIFRLFPALVVPLELRESSDVLMSRPARGQRLTIERMLLALARISRGGEVSWYARGLIISMTESIEHIQAAAKIQNNIFASVPLPVIPLFEELRSLKNSPRILRQMLLDPALKRAAKNQWAGRLQVMVGYSDSSKEAGVLLSRLTIADTLPQLERICKKAGLVPVFFHGSGGSTDRGGGSIEEQTSWWPRSALRNYKVTVQGEMVERSLATPEIAMGQLDHILESAARGLKNNIVLAKSPSLDHFARKVSASYRHQVASERFLEVVEKATPYSYLNLLKLGSRPSKRSRRLSVSGLRAIPWILCWTQTRVLFPTWWGVGSAWTSSTPSEKRLLRQAFKDEPVFTSFVKALGFTLAKTDLAIWHLYLSQSSLPKAQSEESYQIFADEWRKSLLFFQQVTRQKNLTWEKPWLGESIQLRAPMIHPLNILQILAEQSLDRHLLRITVTGIANGMMATG